MKGVELQSSDVNVESKEITQETPKKEENLDGYPRYLFYIYHPLEILRTGLDITNRGRFHKES